MKVFFLVIFIISVGLVSGQNTNELRFIEYLINKGSYNEALYVMEKDTFNYHPNQLDSINFYKGWAYYSVKNLKLSTQSFIKVSKESTFYQKSNFFAGYNQIFLGDYSGAKLILNQLNLPDDPYFSLLNFELSGIEMLQGNWSVAQEKLNRVNKNIAIINQQMSILNKICENHEKHRSKSASLAGIMSGIIPGSGKIYAGKTGEGIASFITVTGFGLIAIENYRKLGIGNFKTILFGGIFVANYVSNIYGSVISVKINDNNYQNGIQNQILFQLHIPLRNFFE